MTTAVGYMTAEELLNLHPDNMRHELVRGELITMPPTSGEHGIRTFNITTLLGSFIRERGLGVGVGAETGFIIGRNPDTVRAPDCAFIARERVPADGPPKEFWPGAPDLAVEVLSPSDSASEILEKIDEWIAAGTRLVWVIDPEKKTVSIYAPNRSPRKLRRDDQLSGEDVLPGFSVPIAEIFR